MIGFIKYIFWLFFSPKGRVNKKVFLIALTCSSIFFLLSFFFGSKIIGVNLVYLLESPNYEKLILILYIICCFLIYMITTWMLKIKRLHDLDLSWGAESFGIFTKNGTKGLNKYGPDPLEKKKNF